MNRKRGMAGLLGALSRRQFMTGAAAVGLSITAMPKFVSAAEEKKLTFANWDTYIGETTLDDFKAETGIEVTMDLFADVSELFAKMRGGNPGYDVIVPSNDWVQRMIQAGMLQELDHSKIPNIKNIYPRFMDEPFDPGRKYSLPYMWGTVGIGYRKSKVSAVPDSWGALYDSDEYAGRSALLSDCGTMIGCALKYLGYSLNSTDKAENEAAAELIIKQKGKIKAFAEDNGQDLLAAGEVDVTMEYSGDIAQLMSEDDDIGYVVPKEGGIIWEDVLAIPASAPHPENAHAFINYIHSPEPNQLITDYIQFATPNKAGFDLMPEEYQTSEVTFPPEDVVAVSEVASYLGEEVTQMREALCTKINAA
ncbi:extracellular solute-binding protein family 1 [Parvibaculum lavamentivorans DS-1]|uniref:Putrescine-binding periplasmic protein n=1 Tax=Parvibaculum lavamentivorans (strain DS-1 / DSM 13023 / NCIMB 13966) TaxID=402881 RepID=A7HTD7_PARL1|nr:spermidine/putrescine ABC transporter substrate-binding protein [Parvibaculum lavamentivorans]ABS63170.1 extracellular solute-binding protein family 1 [Parvibaculum lavamentivorans DS-1]